MRYSPLTQTPRTRQTVTAFLGYNHHSRIGDGEFYDMTNMTGDDYPLLSPRGQRGFYTGGSDIRCLLAKDRLCYVDGTQVVIGQDHYELGLTSGKTEMVSMGAYILFFPDKKYINTAAPADRGSMEASFSADTARIAPCRADGTEITLTQGTDPQEGDYRLSDTLQRYTQEGWVNVTAPYTRLSAQGIGEAFRAGDGVSLEGIPQVGSAGVIQAVGADYLVLPGLGEAAQLEKVTVRRSVPELDYCVEAGNRLWGCRYGLNREGQFVNELYASKLGDFRNWECFQGLSTDSYRASLGTDGEFTGAVAYLGQPLFFKEGVLHRVYGSRPANFQIQSDACQGVQRGCGGSLAIVGETLYYKSRMGVCAYDGSSPVEVSQALGRRHYTAAVAGAHAGKYFLSMADEAGVYQLFVYDTRRGFWHREDNTQVLAFASYNNELYFLDGADRQIKTVYGTGSARYVSPVPWMVQTGLLGTQEPGYKYVQLLELRLTLALNSVVEVYLEYDSSGVWEYAGTAKGRATAAFTLPVRPRRCDHLRLMLKGRGEAKVFSITRTMAKG